MKDQVALFDWEDPSPKHEGPEIITDPVMISSFWAMPADLPYYWQGTNS